MDQDLNEPAYQTVSLDVVCDVLKEHFPEYLSQHCLCGQPIATYMAWIDHVRDLLEPSPSPEGDEKNG